jgi:hypothetical protein
MVGRVNGCNFGGIYGGTSAMGWRTITKPEHFTWKQYAYFLMDTLPDVTKKKFKFHLERFQKSWEYKGYGRNPDVIKYMQELGLEVENTKEVSKLCTKDNIYEIIDEKIYDDDEDYDADEIENLKNLKYDILTAFEKTLKGLGQDENVNEIENELVRIVFDRSKLKTNGSIYTSVIHKQDNSTYNGYMFIKDIPSYFKNYKLFEVLKNFKKLIK